MPGPGLASAASKAVTAVPAHVVIVGLSGLRWADISPATTPALWKVAKTGAAGSLIDYAVLPHTCPADAWLTLNGGDRAQVPHASDGACPALPAVTVVRPGPAGGPGPAGAVAGPARVAAMPSLVAYNHTLKYSPAVGAFGGGGGAGGVRDGGGAGGGAGAGRAGRCGGFLSAGGGGR